MPTRLFLVRHGATELTAEDRFSGATDVPLSEEGRKRVENLASRLADEPLDAIHASPMGRTVETARILARPHGAEVRVEIASALREIDYGHPDGKTRAEVEAQYGDEYDNNPAGNRRRQTSFSERCSDIVADSCHRQIPTGRPRGSNVFATRFQARLGRVLRPQKPVPKPSSGDTRTREMFAAFGED